MTVQRREDAPYRPFCSYRCKMIDLHKWFDGQYRIREPLDVPGAHDRPSTPASGPSEE